MFFKKDEEKDFNELIEEVNESQMKIIWKRIKLILSNFSFALVLIVLLIFFYTFFKTVITSALINHGLLNGDETISLNIFNKENENNNKEEIIKEDEPKNEDKKEASEEDEEIDKEKRIKRIKEEIKKYDLGITIEDKTDSEKKEESKPKQFIGFKDELFKYKGKLLESKYGGKYEMYEYSQKRDLEDRDEIDVDKVYDKYVKEISNVDRKLHKVNEDFSFYEVKKNGIKNENVEFVIVYYHGMGGNKEQGINDYSFGGNFNRVQNLSILNNGVYLTIDGDFSESRFKLQEQFVGYIKKKYGNAKIILSGASQGGVTIWNLVDKIPNKIDGIILMGSITGRESKLNKLKGKRIYISHGTKDHLPFGEKEIFLNKAISKGINTKVIIFEGGVHGTPIRMTDWKKAIKFMLKKDY